MPLAVHNSKCVHFLRQQFSSSTFLYHGPKSKTPNVLRKLLNTIADMDGGYGYYSSLFVLRQSL